MQLYAFDGNDRLISAKDALKQIDYFCPECRGLVHLRGGFHRQNHFYHLEAVHACRQSGKSLEHINVQLFFLKVLPQGDCVLEQHFTGINRIADVVWTSRQLVFEIQCSSISHSEVLARNRDYERLGYEVVWILHDRRFNQKRLTAAEYFLHGLPHYFTNISERGEGHIYDQFSLLEGGLRLHPSKAFPVDVSAPKHYVASSAGGAELTFELVKLRLQNKALYFTRDLVDHYLNLNAEAEAEGCIQAALRIEENNRKLLPVHSNAVFAGLKRAFWSYVVRPYRLLFQLLLERACK